jgi:hypothetical protein
MGLATRSTSAIQRMISAEGQGVWAAETTRQGKTSTTIGSGKGSWINPLEHQPIQSVRSGQRVESTEATVTTGILSGGVQSSSENQVHKTDSTRVSHTDVLPGIDPIYRSMTCYNYGEPGHFVGICTKPKI